MSAKRRCSTSCGRLVTTSELIHEGIEPVRRERLEFALASVQDALRWACDSGGPAEVLAALEEVHIQDLSDLASRHIALARAALRSQHWTSQELAARLSAVA
jgi:hypothetical protein